MKAIRIDFQPASVWSWRLIVPLIVAVILLIAAIIELTVLHRHSQRSTELLAQRHAQTQQKADAEKHALRLSTKKQEAINHAIAALNTPWGGLFEALERHLSNDVALISVVPDVSRQQVKIVAEAKDAQHMTAFVEEIEHDGFLVRPLLVKHEIDEHDANHPYRFAVEAHWKE